MERNNCFLSIIIPVYNTEKYLEKCLTSCLFQNISNFEIIVVNDGSTDNSLSKIESICNNNASVTIISQDNKGLSAARNTGLKKAKGEYIWFVDSDDWIKDNCLSSILNISNSSPDMIAINYLQYTNERYNKPDYPFDRHAVFSPADLFKYNFYHCAPFYIFKRSFLIEHNLLFMEGIFHEDFEYLPRVIFAASSIKFIFEPFYIYRFNPSSITNIINPKKSLDLILISSLLFENIYKQTNNKTIQMGIANLIGLALNNSMVNYKNMNKEDKIEYRTALNNTNLYPRLLLLSNKRKYKIEGIIYKISPSIFFFLHKIIKR